LTVYADNEPARRLYEELGYELEPNGDELVGSLAL
jgi:RimJ/RimL family protein N-acetyltransferase